MPRHLPRRCSWSHRSRTPASRARPGAEVSVQTATGRLILTQPRIPEGRYWPPARCAKELGSPGGFARKGSTRAFAPRLRPRLPRRTPPKWRSPAPVSSPRTAAQEADRAVARPRPPGGGCAHLAGGNRQAARRRQGHRGRCRDDRIQAPAPGIRGHPRQVA